MMNMARVSPEGVLKLTWQGIAVGVSTFIAAVTLTGTAFAIFLNLKIAHDIEEDNKEEHAVHAEIQKELTRIELETVAREGRMGILTLKIDSLVDSLDKYFKEANNGG